MVKLYQRVLPRLGLVVTLSLGLSACAQMVVPTPQQSSSNAIAVQAARIHIFSLSPQVPTQQLEPARKALAAANAAQQRGDYLFAERQTELARIRLDNIQQRLNQSPANDGNQQIKGQLRDLQGRIASLQEKIAATRQQLQETNP
ncbi:hypothetical protein AB4090_11855 [Acidithiobacillus sp. IBUN Pt1247-S3]|uniref:hypothetical protein n=1 Tax=Acidithiobacillus sp. IBUN Pt1247-S3 TaxID=3166642 RepID=UPI0034E388F8